MDVQKEFYVFQPKYYPLKKLNELMRTQGTTSDELITYMTNENIDPNSYIELCPRVFCPIIYQCSLTPSHAKFFLWLLKHGASPHKKLDISTDAKADHILFACHEKFLPTLIDRQHVVLDQPVQEPITRKLCFGNLRRVKLLVKLGVLSHRDVMIAIRQPDLGFQIIDVLIDRIHLICNTRNEKKDIDNLLVKYAEIMKFIKATGCETRNEVSLAQYCAGYYLHPILKVLTNRPPTSVVYHEDADPKAVAIMRQLYNDFRYVETCMTCGLIPDTRIK